MANNKNQKIRVFNTQDRALTTAAGKLIPGYGYVTIDSDDAAVLIAAGRLKEIRPTNSNKSSIPLNEL